MSSGVFLGGMSGALAVALGAFGAHGLKKHITDPNMLKNWDTAAHYHLVHSCATVLTGLVGRSGAPLATKLFVGGVTLFSGSLYAMVLTGERKLGAITPLGGLALIAGWVALGLGR